MSIIVWILIGSGLGLLTSKIVNNSGEGTVVDILLGIVGAILGGWLLGLFGNTGVTGVGMDSLYSAVAAALVAIGFLVAYHMFFRHRML